MNRRSAILVFLILCACSVWHALHYYAALPAMIPRDSFEAGPSDALTSKVTLLQIYLIAVAGTAFCFPGLGLLITRMKVSRINLPNKEYWLAPERKQRSLDFMVAYTAWFGSATLLFLMRIFHGCFRAVLGEGMRPDPPLPTAIATGVLYGAFILFWCILPLIRFRKP